MARPGRADGGSGGPGAGGRLERLDAYRSAHDLEAVWFGQPSGSAWLTGGGDNVVDCAAPVGVAAAGYDGETVTVVTDGIEAPRLRAEELPGEWREHHQGGAAGVAGREWIATPDSAAELCLPAAYAWNPTVAGAKSEDTVLVGDGHELLTATGDWPTSPFRRSASS